jgi:hypothetical protein
VFSAWSVPRSYLEGNWRYNVVTGYSPESNGMSEEAEECPLLRFLTMKYLVKTSQRNSHCWELLQATTSESSLRSLSVEIAIAL